MNILSFLDFENKVPILHTIRMYIIFSVVERCEPAILYISNFAMCIDKGYSVN